MNCRGAVQQYTSRLSNRPGQSTDIGSMVLQGSKSKQAGSRPELWVGLGPKPVFQHNPQSFTPLDTTPSHQTTVTIPLNTAADAAPEGVPDSKVEVGHVDSIRPHIHTEAGDGTFYRGNRRQHLDKSKHLGSLHGKMSFGSPNTYPKSTIEAVVVAWGEWPRVELQDSLTAQDVQEINACFNLQDIAEGFEDFEHRTRITLSYILHDHEGPLECFAYKVHCLRTFDQRLPMLRFLDSIIEWEFRKGTMGITTNKLRSCVAGLKLVWGPTYRNTQVF